MTVSTVRGWELGAVLPSSLTAVREAALRVSCAILHILATVAVARSLRPEATGVYFEGAVIAFGLATLLKNKYEFYGAPYIASCRESIVGIPVSRLIAGLSRQMLIRATIICCILLVLTADLDILEPRLRPFLQTYLPFVLAIPLLALSTMLSSFLRASRRPGLSVLAGNFAVNLVLLATALLGGQFISLVLFSWAFLIGNIVSAGLSLFIVRAQFRDSSKAPVEPSTRAAQWAEVHTDIALNAGAARSQAVLIWGPLCLLAVLVPAAEFALCAVATRTAQAVDLLQPSLNLIACNETPIFPALFRTRGGRTAWVGALAATATASSILFAAFILGLPVILALFGSPYDQAVTLFIILLAAQWLNGIGRVAIRYFVIHWEICRGQWMLDVSAVASILVCALGVGQYGNLAAAAGMLVGALIINTLITVRMLMKSERKLAI